VPTRPYLILTFTKPK